jgi:anti-sigma regulatory factor (Ser/Thr protein kinase)/predicted ArsR family transcriptional regulator
MEWFLDRHDPAAARRLRRAVTDYLARHADDAQRVRDAELVVGELVANAIRHGEGLIWVSVTWPGDRPLLQVKDLGAAFELDPKLPESSAVGGRGLYLASRLSTELRLAARSAAGKTVEAVLDVLRAPEATPAGVVEIAHPLPRLEEASPEGFDREAFLRALVVQLSQVAEHLAGPRLAEEIVTSVGASVGHQMELEYRRAKEIVDRLTPEQIGECLVRLKAAISGDFFVVELTDTRIVLENRRCPFGAEAVQRSPALCRMTSSVFGGVASRNAAGHIASVRLEERIAVGDPQCRVVIDLAPAAPGAPDRLAHVYRDATPGE